MASQVSTPGSAVLPFSSRASRASAVQPLERLRGGGEGPGGAQYARAPGHGPLDREPGLGGEQGVRGLPGVLDGGGHARVEAVSARLATMSAAMRSA